MTRIWFQLRIMISKVALQLAIAPIDSVMVEPWWSLFRPFKLSYSTHNVYAIRLIVFYFMFEIWVPLEKRRKRV